MRNTLRPALFALSLLPALAQAELYITIVQGLGGADQYESEFTEQREAIHKAALSVTDEERVGLFHGEAATREALLAHFDALTRRMKDDDRLALYLIGHGSFDGETYKFNIPGPDISGSDIREVLEKLPGSNHVVVNTSSTSGAMIEAVTGVPAPRGTQAAGSEATDISEEDIGYILIAATRNGNERNSTHFGRYFAEALGSEAADLNKNNNISVQEAFDYAKRMVETHFEESGRLATEHAQLRGAGASRFSLARLDTQALQTAAANPLLEELLKQRLELDEQIEELQLRRSQYSNAEYLERLQTLVLQSAELSERIEAEQARAGTGAAAASGSEPR